MAPASMTLKLLLLGCAAGLDNGVARTPPLGWMSWMYYTTEISESIIKGVVDEIVDGGYKDAGYKYVCIDDGWSTHRDPNTHELVADPKKFPSGMKKLAEYVHSRGLLFGMYADVGSLTCGGYSGLGMDANLSSKQYIQDVATFASWGVDALKVDGCYQKPEIMNITYPALSDAINASGGCSGGPGKVGQHVYSQVLEKCNTARDMNDIYDNIDSLYSIIGAYTKPDAISFHNQANRPGYFSDADMLTAGAGGLSLVEETMQMVMWALFNSPLVMSNDLPRIPNAAKQLLLNREIIAINQDVTHPDSFNVTDGHTYCKNLAHGTIALAGLHQTSLGPPSNITLSPARTATSSRLSDCLMPAQYNHSNATRWRFRDVINGIDLGEGASVDCLAAQPGVCLVTATPVTQHEQAEQQQQQRLKQRQNQKQQQQKQQQKQQHRQTQPEAGVDVDVEVEVKYTQPPVAMTVPEYLSIAVDMGILTEASKWALFVAHIDDNSTAAYAQNASAFRLLTRALLPAYLRLGGTPADTIVYNISADTPPPVDVCLVPPLPASSRASTPQAPHVLGACQFSKVVRWAERVSATALPVVFDLNILSNRIPGAFGEYDSRWDPRTAAALVEYASKHHPNLVGWELGNEPEGWVRNFDLNISTGVLAQDFKALRNLLDSGNHRHGHGHRSVHRPNRAATADQAIGAAGSGYSLWGPDYGISGCYASKRGCTAYTSLTQKLAGVTDFSTFHFYNVNAKSATASAFVSPAVLDDNRLATEAACRAPTASLAHAHAHAHAAQAPAPAPPVWLGESATASGGGLPNVSGTYSATFIFLDKLGAVARWGGAGIMRQSLFGGHYALLDPETFSPRPTYWLAMLFKRLTSNENSAPAVLEVGGDRAMNRTLRLYARCGSASSASSASGSTAASASASVVVLFGSNLSPSFATSLHFAKLSPALAAAGVSREDYILTGALGGSELLLNGHPLQATMATGDGALPHIEGARAVSVAAPLVIPPFSSFFAVFKKVDVEC